MLGECDHFLYRRKEKHLPFAASPTTGLVEQHRVTHRREVTVRKNRVSNWLRGSGREAVQGGGRGRAWSPALWIQRFLLIKPWDEDVRCATVAS